MGDNHIYVFIDTVISAMQNPIPRIVNKTENHK